MVVRKGTTIYEGIAVSQVINGGTGWLPEGNQNVYIPEVDAS